MARQQGIKFKLYEVTSGGSDVAIAHLRSNSVNLESEPIDISTKSSDNWREFLPGYRSFSMDCEGVTDWAATGGEKDASALVAYFMSGTTFKTKSTDKVSGSKSFEGDVIITNFQITASHDDAVLFTCSLQGTGALAFNTVV
jgi:predicted secreted protein